MKKKRIIIIVILLVFLMANLSTYYFTGDSIINILKGNRIKFIPVESMEYNGQSYTIDDYTITLEYSRYDEDTCTGYCIFKTEKKNGKRVEGSINQWHNTRYFGENNRFSFAVEASREIRSKKVGKVMYTYITFYRKSKWDHFAIHLLDSSVPVDDDDLDSSEPADTYCGSKSYDFYEMN